MATTFKEPAGAVFGVPQDGCKTFSWRQIIRSLQKKNKICTFLKQFFLLGLVAGPVIEAIARLEF